MPTISVRIVFAIVMVMMVLLSLFPVVPGMNKVELPTVGLVLLIFLPWISNFLTEFSVGGVSVKLRELDKKITAVAEQQVQTDDRLIQSGGAIVQREGVALDTSVRRPLELEELAAKYIETRASMPSGATRTSKMTSIFVEMRASSKALGSDWGSEGEWLSSDDAGKNLAAVSYLNAFPDKIKPTHLIDLVERNTQPFIQYWSLRTINSYVQAYGANGFALSDIKRLKALEKILGPSIDRGILVRSVNDALNSSINR